VWFGSFYEFHVNSGVPNTLKYPNSVLANWYAFLRLLEELCDYGLSFDWIILSYWFLGINLFYASKFLLVCFYQRIHNCSRFSYYVFRHCCFLCSIFVHRFIYIYSLSFLVYFEFFLNLFLFSFFSFLFVFVCVLFTYYVHSCVVEAWFWLMACHFVYF